MPRPALNAMSISRLENLLLAQKQKKSDLLRERKKIASQLAKIDAKIAGIDGKSAALGGLTPSGRVRNAKSLVATMIEILEKNPKGLSVGDLMKAVLDSGYQSTSDNFRNIINQNLITQKKRFTSVERGVYALKK
jgi:hypothetical protein